MRPKAEPAGRWDGSAGEDVPRGVQGGHTPCDDPQRRHVRREERFMRRERSESGDDRSQKSPPCGFCARERSDSKIRVLRSKTTEPNHLKSFEEAIQVKRSEAELVRSSKKEHREDALAPTAEEGRSDLRKAMGSRKQALIHGFPNGETRRGRTPVTLI